MTPPERRLVLASLVLVGAALLRLWRLEQAPPGFHVDEAFHLLSAQKIAQGQAFPVYIVGNYGNEPLFAYLSALTLTCLGPTIWAGRLASAWAGLISLAFTIRLGDEMFPRTGMGTLAGFALAMLYSHLHFSRLGSQPILAPLAAAGSMAMLWLGARTGDRRAYLLAGVCLGLGLSAYLAFRLFPLAPLLAGLGLLYARPTGRRSLLLGGLLAGAAALIIYAPLGWYFIQHPVWFFNRFTLTTDATLGATGWSQALLDHTLRTISGLFLKGDMDGRYNLPARPALDIVQLLCFAVGLGLCARRARQPESWALLAWLGVGLLPSALTEDAPQFGRTTMALPALALMAARGASALWGFARWPATRAVLVAALALSAALSVRDYFGRYASAPETFTTMNGDELAIALALRSAPAGARLYATPLQRDYYLAYVDLAKQLEFRTEEPGKIDRGYWSIEYLLGPEAYERFGAFNGRECLVLPSVTTAPTMYAVLTDANPEALPALQAAFPAGRRARATAYGDRLALETYQVPAGQTAQVMVATSRNVNFGAVAQLTGYTLETQTLRPGDEIRLNLVWKAETRTPSGYKIFIHLIGPPKSDGNPIYAQHDAEPCLNSYPTWQWTPGELVVDRYSIRIPADVPVGSYSLQAGWYEAVEGGERLTATDERHQPLGASVELAQIQIAPP